MMCNIKKAEQLIQKNTIILNIILLVLTVPICNSYTTVITSNYTTQIQPEPPIQPIPNPPEPEPQPQPQPQPTPPIPSPPAPPNIKYPLMQVQTFRLIKDGSQKMGGASNQTSRNMSWTFKKQFQNSNALKAFATIIQFQDETKRINITFYLQMLSLTKTNVIVKYNDFSTTRSFNSVAVGIKLKLRGIVFDISKCVGFDFVYVAAQLPDNALYLQYIPTPFQVSQQTLILSYINRLSFYVPLIPLIGNYYFVLPKITLASNKNNIILQINGQFINVSPKIVGIILVFMKNTQSIAVTSGKLNLSQKTANISIEDNMYYFIGLTSFKILHSAAINIDISSELDKIKNSYSDSNYRLSLDYGIVTDITPQINIPNPDPNPDPNTNPNPTPNPNPNPNTNTNPQPQIQPQPQIRPQTFYSFSLTQIISYSYFNNTFQVIYQNVPQIGQIQLQQFEIFSSSSIKKINISYNNGKIIILCSYQNDIRGIPISAQLKWIKDDISFTATTNLNLDIFPPLKISSNLSKRYIVGIITDIVQYLYLTTFIVSLLSRKLIGIEMISFIQMTFYSLISLGPLTPFFSGLYKMKYVSGINMKFDNLVETKIPLIYSNLSLRSNFLSNMNIMYLPVFICPLMFGILYIAFHYNQSYKHKPRLKIYAKSAICEWIFTFIMFNSYNIYISLVVNLQSLGTTQIIPLVVGLLIGLTPLIAIIFYYQFQPHYQQFNSQLNHSNKRLKFKVESSKKLSTIYPLLIGFQMIFIPLAFSSQIILDYSLYIVFVITLFVNLFVWIMRPYNQKLDNVRICIHRALVTLMTITLIICKTQINTNTDPDSFIMNLVWIILLLLLIGFIINFPFIVWQLILWIKQKGVIDHKMYLNHKSKTQKLQAQIPKKFQNKDPLYYPILEYGQNLKIQERQKKKRINLANVNCKKSKIIDRSVIEDNVNMISYEEMNQSTL